MPAHGEFYRLVEATPPSEEDFLSGLEIQRRGLRFKKRRWSDECLAAGLSVFGKVEEAKYVRESTGPMRDMRIAVGKVDGPGAIKSTPHPPKKSSHHTWWSPLHDEAWQTFRIVA